MPIKAIWGKKTKAAMILAAFVFLCEMGMLISYTAHPSPPVPCGLRWAGKPQSG
jgi:hypothetical protein